MNIKGKYVGLVIGALIFGFIGVYVLTAVLERDSSASASDPTELDYESQEFRTWCSDVKVQRNLPQTDETFAVSGDCRKTRDSDGSWSLNCNLTPAALPLPSIEISSVLAAETGNETEAACKSSPNGPDSYKFSFRHVTTQGKFRSSLTHYKMKKSGEKEMIVYWSNSTQTEMEKSDLVEDSASTVDGKLEVDELEPEVTDIDELNSNSTTNDLKNNSTTNKTAGKYLANATSRLPIKSPAWNRSMCASVLPECPDSNE